MRLRTAAVLALTSACAAGAVPAYAYWSQPLVVELTLRSAQVAAPEALSAERSGPDGTTVTLRWQAPEGPSGDLAGYLVERADLASTVGGSGWTVLDAAATCTPDRTCVLSDGAAPVDAAYRVTTVVGNWLSDPSAVVRSHAGPDLTEPSPSPTATGPDTPGPTPSDPTMSTDPTSQPDSTTGPTTAPSTTSTVL